MKIIKKSEFLKKKNIKEFVNINVLKIIEDVYKNRDKAIFKYMKIFDKKKINKHNFKIKISNIDFKNLSKSFKKSILKSYKRINNYHLIQKKSLNIKSWYFKDKNANIIGQMSNPIKKVAIYAPGGLASYPSSILMSYIPAKIAGVKKIYLISPIKKLNLNFLYTAKFLGIKSIYNIGGAQAIAAFSFGTKLFPKVDKIVGPGNRYVNDCKKIISSYTGIDILAGPTEIMIITDGVNVKPKYLAYDLFSQMEHDYNAKSVIVSNNINFLKKIKKIILIKKKKIYKKKIIFKSLKRMKLVFVKKTNDFYDIVKIYAPEHLEIILNFKIELSKFRNAGSIFLGKYSPESIGDYSVGCNHIIPTNGCSKFSSPLGVYDFVKFTNITKLTKKGFRKLSKQSIVISRKENLPCHGLSIIKRYE
ncbi:histidinol dehydrogenase [Candidatus Vidania fulgoroideorum]